MAIFIQRLCMAPKSTIYHFSIELSDMDRGVYETLKLPVALHPSENTEFMLTRVLAFALEFDEGIAFSPGLGATEEPPISVKGFDGTYRTWIEIGSPNAERLHRAAKLATRVAIYCHRSATLIHQQLAGERIFRAEELPLYSFEEGFIGDLARHLDRRNIINLSRSEQTLYIQLNGHDFSSPITERRLG